MKVMVAEGATSDDGDDDDDNSIVHRCSLEASAVMAAGAGSGVEWVEGALGGLRPKPRAPRPW